METSTINQHEDRMIAVRSDEDIIKCISNEITPIMLRFIREAPSGHGCALVMRFYPCEDTSHWMDFVSWQVVKEGGTVKQNK